MDLEAFKSNFGLLADTPDAIPKLREMILQLAVRGKLVPQDPNDEPASELLKKIAAEKERLIKEGKIKKSELLPPVRPEEMPYELPKGWEWTNLQSVSIKITDGEHLSPRKADSGMLLLTAKHVTDTGISLADPQFVDFDDAVKFRERCDPGLGDILICSRGTIGRCTIVDIEDEFCIMGSVILVRPHEAVIGRYLTSFLKTEFAQQWMLGSSGATAVKALYLKDIKGCPLPLSPLSEQQRIVAKVDQLMALCDELEGRQKRRDTLRISMNGACLNELTLPEPEQSRLGWNRVRDHFQWLYDIPENVAVLRQCILQLAVMGRLVPQDPNDEPASELLKKIATEKQRLVSEGKIKSSEPLPPVRPEEMPYELPRGWEWAAMQDISTNIHYGYTASADSENRKIRLLRITDIQNDRVDWDTVPGCNIEHKIVSNYELFEGDILIARTGGTIGKSYLVPALPVTAVFASYLIRIIPSKRVNPMYLKIFLGSQLYWSQLYEKSMGTGQPNVNGTSLKSLQVPISPFLEQHRIVAKVDQLMALCDELESKLKPSLAAGEKLMEATIHKALSY